MSWEIAVFLLGFCIVVRVIGLGGAFAALLLVALFVTTATASERDMVEYANAYGEELGIPALTTVTTFESRYQLGQSWVARNKRTKEVTGWFIEIADHVAEGRIDVWKNTVRHEYCHLWAVKMTGEIREHGKFHGRTWISCAKDNRVDFSHTVMN